MSSIRIIGANNRVTRYDSDNCYKLGSDSQQLEKLLIMRTIITNCTIIVDNWKKLLFKTNKISNCPDNGS